MSLQPRPTAVAGTFYPAEPRRLAGLVADVIERARIPAGSGAPEAAPGGLPAGILVPHAGLVFSGAVAAAGWACLGAAGTGGPPTVVILGTNHGAAWLDGIGAWIGGPWATPLGAVAVDEALAQAVVGLGPPFIADAEAHLGEHSIEVQLPLLATIAPAAPIVPLAVSCGTGARAVEAGERLGRLLASWSAGGRSVLLAISTDMAHYPGARDAAAVTEGLLPSIEALEPASLAAAEGALRDARIPGLACGMCGIEPAVVGLAAIRAMGATRGMALAAATSADARGPADRTVGYLAVRFDR